MLETFVFIILACVWVGVAINAMAALLDRGVTLEFALSVLALAGSLAWFINSYADYEKQYPCTLYEARMHYNAATKTPMPMRVCVERGEWVDE